MIRKLAPAFVVFSFLVSSCSLQESQIEATTVVVPADASLKTEVDEVRIIQPESYVLGKANSVEVKEMRSITHVDQLEVQATLLNNRGRRDIVYYRMRWLDKAGVQIGQYAPWESVTLEGFQSSVLVLRAPSPLINDFRLEIRPRD